MANNDAAGAEAAVRYFVELADYVLYRGDVEQWNAVTDENCVFCRSISDSAAEIRAGNWRRVGGGLAISGSPEVVETSVADFYLVDVEIVELPHSYLDPQGSTVENSSGGAGPLTFGVQHTGDGWRLMVAGTADEVSSP